MHRFLRAALAGAILTTAGLAAASAQALRISLPEGHDFTNPDRQVMSISPDGKRFVYVAGATLYARSVGDGQPVAVKGPLAGRGIASPVFSPDGQSVLYWASDGSLLQRVPADGGTPVTVCKADMPFGMSWGSDDRIVFGQGAKGILRVSANGGAPETIVTMRNGEVAHGPQMLPGGNAVLFTLGSESTRNWDEAQIVVQSLKSEERKTVIPAGSDARYLPNGYLVYALGGRIMGVRFDPRTLETSGQAVALIENVQTARATGTAQFSIAANGSLAYVSGRPVPVQLGLVSFDGTRRMLGEVPDANATPRVSPDGRKVAIEVLGTKSIYVADLDNFAGLRKVISGTYPLFSPDSQWLAFGKTEDGVEKVFRQRADGSGDPELLVVGRAPEDWPAGDQGFSFIRHSGNANDYDIWTWSPTARKATPLAVIDESAQLSSRFSPDVHWVAYMSSESGDWQVYLQPFPPNAGVKYQVSKEGGRVPIWSVDGRSLMYENNGHLYSVAFQAGENPTFGKPVELPVTGFLQPLIRRNFDMTPDGKYFVMLFRAGPEVEVISNWADQLKQRVKAD